MTNLKFLTLVLFSSIFALTSCEDDPIEVNEMEAEEVTLSRETNYGEDWIYFSFETEAEVSGIDDSNYKTSANWDIAFNRYNVRTNGGTSGQGKGEAYDLGKVDWNSVKEAKEDGYTPDSEIQIVESFDSTTHEPIYISSTGSSVFAGCIEMTYGDAGPAYSSNEHVYIMKTAAGKYVKIMITSFYNDLGESGYISFKYSYQNNGSLIFE